ncbi:MAG TPA: hypothetical protein VNA57_13500 [Acidimicrobiales bacterium]|nr:hypothetical protein [Acidimicrobiales bacterium]
MTNLSSDLYADPRRIDDPSSCFFYHFMDLPGHGPVGDYGWDLRPGVDRYLAGVDLAGRRVLEIGPASGFLTFHMESEGAEVVAVELGPTTPWDVVPQSELDIEAVLRERHDVMEKMRNGFWFARATMGGKARVHYGSAYELPEGLGRFDVSVMASILLHTRDPLRIVERCARLTDRTLVIVDHHHPDIDGRPVAHLTPTRENGVWDTWWAFTPEFFVAYCNVLGFTRTRVEFHEQRHISGGAEAQIPMFTVVAERK